MHSLKGKVNFVLQVEDNNKEFKKYQIYIDNLLFKIPISNWENALWKTKDKHS